MSIIEEKKALRTFIRQSERALDAAYKAESSDAICHHVLALEEYRRAKVVFAFAGTVHEIDTSLLLGETLADPEGTESGTVQTLRGLGLLPTRTVFTGQKHRTQDTAAVTAAPFAGAALTGYQIHTGRTEVQRVPFCTLADGTPEGCVQDNVFGTYLHGLFDTGELTEKLVALLCRRKGIAPDSAALIPMEQYRQQQFDLLADGVRGALDLDAVYAAMGLENPRRNAQ